LDTSEIKVRGSGVGRASGRFYPAAARTGAGRPVRSAIDTLRQGSGQSINPENFTHGNSAQRMAALRRGVMSADMGECDVYLQEI
jgi:uncharacterized protein